MSGERDLGRVGSRRGFTLLEVLAAVTILAVGLTALTRLVAHSVATVSADTQLTRAMLVARTLVAEAELAPPEPGHTEGARSGGLRFERDISRTPHADLREVRVRVYPEAGGSGCEIVELVRVPPV